MWIFWQYFFEFFCFSSIFFPISCKRFFVLFFSKIYFFIIYLVFSLCIMAILFFFLCVVFIAPLLFSSLLFQFLLFFSLFLSLLAGLSETYPHFFFFHCSACFSCFSLQIRRRYARIASIKRFHDVRSRFYTRAKNEESVKV